MRLLKTIFFFFLPLFALAQHPVGFMTASEAAQVKKDINKYPLLKSSFLELKAGVDKWVGKEIDVPVPKDPAGGYSHEAHKSNYMLLFNSGMMYQLTGDIKYSRLVRDILLKYAVLNPTLKKHPQATSSSPGHLFWQALNDANWLVYAGMAYDLVHQSLSKEERKTIEDGAFKPEVEYLTKDLKNWFDLIHNHGVWACAGVGIVGIASDNKDYVDMALYGTAKDGKSGFIAQMNNLFSPDGYYTEGPYYVRYAILPFYLFANALNHARPSLKIFQQRDQILRKALLAGLQQTNIDGRFFPLNDALKEKDFTTNEMVTAVDIAWQVYGTDNGLLTVAKKQNKVIPSLGGASLAASLSGAGIPEYYPYKSVEYQDGVNGDEGGVSFIRTGTGKNLSTLIFKYTSHGLSHGHFDKLNLNYFHQGEEILSDYGSVRFVNVEQKYGGRYLPENDAYASQTIAHNTIVVDETSHFNGKEKTAEEYHGDKLFSDLSNKKVQVVAAKDEHAYAGVQLQRTVYVLQIPGENELIADLIHVNTSGIHNYDLPFHYNGQIINTSFKYTPFIKKQETLGKANGYQYLWKEAEASVRDTLVQFTFLNKQTYYSVSSLIQDSASIFFTRSGANDPNFNLRSEPAFIIRKRSANAAFVSVLETHGKFDPVTETSVSSYPSVKEIKLLLDNEQFTVVSLKIKGKEILIAQCNKDFALKANHQVSINGKNISWNGPYTVWYEGKILK